MRTTLAIIAALALPGCATRLPYEMSWWEKQRAKRELRYQTWVSDYWWAYIPYEENE